MGALAGLVSGPSTLKIVRIPSSLRGPIACRIAEWWAGANINPTPRVSIQDLTWVASRSIRTPAASSTSADPDFEETERLPCFATRPPAAATTNAEAVDTLKMFAPSPPVPQVSTKKSFSTSTFCDSSRITLAAPTISSIVSPFIRRPINTAPICASVASPVMINRITAIISSAFKSRFAQTSIIASWIVITTLPL